MLVCDTCTLEQPEDQFLRPGRPTKLGTPPFNTTCLKCRRKAAVQWAKRNYKRPSGSRHATRERQFARLGGENPSCHCCGETLQKALSLGKEDKKVWCLNCKWVTGLYGACHTITGDSVPDIGFCQGD